MIAKTADGSHYRQESAPARTARLDEVLRAMHAMAADVRWALWRWREARRTRQQLFALPDYMLKDIGLSRANLISATMCRVREEEAMRRGARR